MQAAEYHPEELNHVFDSVYRGKEAAAAAVWRWSPGFSGMEDMS
jgi:hypothetical protein